MAQVEQKRGRKGLWLWFGATAFLFAIGIVGSQISDDSEQPSIAAQQRDIPNDLAFSSGSTIAGASDQADSKSGTPTTATKAASSPFLNPLTQPGLTSAITTTTTKNGTSQTTGAASTTFTNLFTTTTASNSGSSATSTTAGIASTTTSSGNTTSTAGNTTTTAAQTTTTQATTTTIPERRPHNFGNVTWDIIKREEFNGNSLNDSMWEYGWYRQWDDQGYDRPVNGNETACYHTDQVTVANGEMTIEMRPTTAAENTSGICQKKDGTQAYFVAGFANTRNRYEIFPGTYMETRVWLQGSGTTIYNWPAFWANDIGNWPDGGEFDILEVLQGKPCSNYHYANPANGERAQAGKRCSVQNANSWHYIGLKWNYNGTVEFYHNGVRVNDHNGSPWLLDTVGLAGQTALTYRHNINLQLGMPGSDSAGYAEPTAANPHKVKFDYVDVYRM